MIAAPTSIPQLFNIVVIHKWLGWGSVYASARAGRSHRRSLSEMTVTRTLASIPTSSSTCIFRLLQRYSSSPNHLTNNVCRKISTLSSVGMDFPAGLSHPKAGEPIVNIGRNSAVYPLGVPASSQRSIPSLRFESCEMVVEEGQAWVVVGTSGAGKDVLLQVSSSRHYGCRATLNLVLVFLLSLSGTTVITRSYQDPPVPSSTRRPLSILDPPTHSTRSLQIRLPRLLLAQTQVPNRFLGLLRAIRRGVGRRQTNVTRNPLSGIGRKD